MDRQTKILNKFIVTSLVDETKSLSQIQLVTGASLDELLDSLEILERYRYICRAEKRDIIYFSTTRLGRRMLQKSNRV